MWGLWSPSSNIRSASPDYLTFSPKWKVCHGSILGRSSIFSLGNLRHNTAFCRDTGANFVFNSTSWGHHIAPLRPGQIRIASICWRNGRDRGDNRFLDPYAVQGLDCLRPMSVLTRLCTWRLDDTSEWEYTQSGSDWQSWPTFWISDMTRLAWSTFLHSVMLSLTPTDTPVIPGWTWRRNSQRLAWRRVLQVSNFVVLHLQTPEDCLWLDCSTWRAPLPNNKGIF